MSKIKTNKKISNARHSAYIGLIFISIVSKTLFSKDKTACCVKLTNTGTTTNMIFNRANTSIHRKKQQQPFRTTELNNKISRHTSTASSVSISLSTTQISFSFLCSIQFYAKQSKYSILFQSIKQTEQNNCSTKLIRYFF